MRGGRRHRVVRRLVLAVALLLIGYVTAAYLLAPALWIAVEERRPAPGPMLTRTSEGIPGDPINIGLEGDEAAVVRAFHAAGWFPADPVTVETSLRIGESVLLDRPYDDAPVSSLFYEGRRQDLAFEQPHGNSADERQHVRLWRVREGASPLWLGSVTFDSGVELSRTTGEITHRIAPDVDAARDNLVDDLNAAGVVASRHAMAGIGPTTEGRNGDGDPYQTDGEAVVLVLKEGD